MIKKLFNLILKLFNLVLKLKNKSDIFNLEESSLIDKKNKVVRVINPFPKNNFDAGHDLGCIFDQVERKYNDLQFTGEWKTIGGDFLFYFK
jgi:hypothetical protein